MIELPKVTEIETRESKTPPRCNVGISLLKIWMCFEVVLVHFWKRPAGGELAWPLRILPHYLGVAVPVFMLLSFTLTDVAAAAHDNSKIRHRLRRLLVPQIFWTVAYYVVYKALDICKGTSLAAEPYTFWWQLFLGHSMNMTVWFQIDLIVLTVLGFLLFRFLSERQALICVTIGGLLALVFQYSGGNWAMFENVSWSKAYYFNFVKYPVGRFFEMIPYAVVGIWLCRFMFFKKCSEHWLYIVSLALFGTFFFLNYRVFVAPRGYGYGGFYLIAMALVTLPLFYYLPLGWLPETAAKAINHVAGYTMEVYFMHRLTRNVLYHTGLNELLKMRSGSIYDCIVIYIVCCLSAWAVKSCFRRLRTAVRDTY